MKKRDLSDLAQKTNVSKATISRALNHCPGVDHETRRRVLEAAGSAVSVVVRRRYGDDSPRYTPLFLESRFYRAAGGNSRPSPPLPPVFPAV